jgi:hypothetical protein
MTQPQPARESSTAHPDVRSKDAIKDASVARAATKLEVIVIPVSDVDGAKARTSRDGCSASWSGPSAGAFWKRRLKTPSRPSKPGTPRLERQARLEREAHHEPATRVGEFTLALAPSRNLREMNGGAFLLPLF